MTDYGTLEVEREGRVAVVRFARPDVLNAMNGQFFREWVEATDQLNADDDVGALVVTGSGRAFSSGADVADFRRASEGDEQVKRDWARYQPIAFSGKRLTESKPLIGAINGLAPRRRPHLHLLVRPQHRLHAGALLDALRGPWA